MVRAERKELVDWVLSGSKMFWSLARKLIGDNTPLIGLFLFLEMTNRGS